VENIVLINVVARTVSVAMNQEPGDRTEFHHANGSLEKSS